MIQGTGSNVGKSFVVAGLCRAYTRRGLTVRPFKPQNMSNNAAVTADGGEIGRAQALQARACGVAPATDMNPVLLKPQTDLGAQVVVHGKVRGNAKAREYQNLKGELLPAVLESFQRLAAEADLVIAEGAGSPAEVNLRGGDIANMGFAQAAGVPVVLVGDIDRGGVIASIVGTWVLLDEADRAHLAGFAINKFRGDASLFDGGLKTIAERTGLESFGVIPHFPEAHLLPAEDAVGVEHRGTASEARESPPIRLAVPVFSRISNFDDLDPLRAEPGVSVEMVEPGQPIPGGIDLIVLPGSKATMADLAFLRQQGWDLDIRVHVRRGGHVLGLCGGYQMLGRRLRDPAGVEGEPGEVEGLGLLDIDTELAGGKTLAEAEGYEVESREAVRGYEMHIGRTAGPGLERPMLRLAGRHDGAVSADGRVRGCYLHGLFAADGFRDAYLNKLRRRDGGGIAYDSLMETVLDGVARHLEDHLDLDGLLAAAKVIEA
jgi:adenosylcobyric acid synthase